MSAPKVAWFAAAAAVGWGADGAWQHCKPGRRIPAAAVGLILAAGIYPLRRPHSEVDSSLVVETVIVGVAGVVSVRAVTTSSPRRRRLLGASWLAHSLYDAAAPHTGAEHRLPSWYPAACAGYDVGLGLRLVLTP